MAEAKAAGIQPLDFWHMTYREIYAAIAGDAIRRRRDRQAQIAQAWQTAAWASFTKRLPKLSTVLAKLEPKREMSNRELRASILGIAKAMNADVVHRKRGEA